MSAHYCFYKKKKALYCIITVWIMIIASFSYGREQQIPNNIFVLLLSLLVSVVSVSLFVVKIFFSNFLKSNLC